MSADCLADSQAANPTVANEFADVCVICEDECVCGAAKSTTASSVKKPVLTLPDNKPPQQFPAHIKVQRFDSLGNDLTSLYSTPSDPPPRKNTAIGDATSSIGAPKKRGKSSKVNAHTPRPAVVTNARPFTSMNPSSVRTGPSSHSRGSTASQPKKGKARATPKLARHEIPPVKAGTRVPARVSSSSHSNNQRLSRVTRDLAADDDEYSDISDQFPMFMPASLLGSESSEDGSECSHSSTSSSESSDDIDSVIEAEETELIVTEETLAMKKPRLRREREREDHLDGGGVPEGGRRWDKVNWNNRGRRKGSVSIDGSSAFSSSSDDSSSSDADDEDGADGADDDDEDVDGDVFGVPFQGAWSEYDEEDEEYDAQLFFANLSDSSSGSSSSDPEPEDASPERLGENGMDFERRDSQLPLVLTENLDGQLVFAHGMRDGEGASDVHFDTTARKLAPDVIIHTIAPVTEQPDSVAASSSSSFETEPEEDVGNTTEEEELDPATGIPSRAEVVNVQASPSFPLDTLSINPISTINTPVNSPSTYANGANLPSIPSLSPASTVAKNAVSALSESSLPTIEEDDPPIPPNITTSSVLVSRTDVGQSVVPGTPRPGVSLKPALTPGSFHADEFNSTPCAIISAPRGSCIPSPYMGARRRKPRRDSKGVSSFT